jgi:hypothetical protein
LSSAPYSPKVVMDGLYFCSAKSTSLNESGMR